MPICENERVIGKVTSGCLSPTFNHPIAMGYVSSDFEGDVVDVNFGKQQLPAKIVSLPFYKK